MSERPQPRPADNAQSSVMGMSSPTPSSGALPGFSHWLTYESKILAGSSCSLSKISDPSIDTQGSSNRFPSVGGKDKDVSRRKDSAKFRRRATILKRNMRSSIPKTVTDSLFHVRPSKQLPTLQMANFVEFDLPFTNLQQLWGGKLSLVNLRLINLKHSNLIRLPDLSKTRSLVRLNLQSCINLVEISSICNLQKLENLDVRGCKALTNLPSLIHLKVLKTLHLSDCPNLKELPSSIGGLQNLVLLDLGRCTGLCKLPRTIIDLKHLQSLNIGGCRNLLKRVISIQSKNCPQWRGSTSGPAQVHVLFSLLS